MKKTLDIAQLKAITHLSYSTIWRLSRLGHFPRGIKISTRRIVWLEEDIDRWLEMRQARR